MVSKIDSYINELSRSALIGTVTAKNGWLINNGIYYTGRLGTFHSTETKGLQVVTDAMKIYPYLGEQYFVVALSKLRRIMAGKMRMVKWLI